MLLFQYSTPFDFSFAKKTFRGFHNLIPFWSKAAIEKTHVHGFMEGEGKWCISGNLQRVAIENVERHCAKPGVFPPKKWPEIIQAIVKH